MDHNISPGLVLCWAVYAYVAVSGQTRLEYESFPRMDDCCLHSMWAGVGSSFPHAGLVGSSIRGRLMLFGHYLYADITVELAEHGRRPSRLPASIRPSSDF